MLYVLGVAYIDGTEERYSAIFIVLHMGKSMRTSFSLQIPDPMWLHF